jgi:hypothetical protein
MIALYYIIKSVRELPAPFWSLCAKLGLAIGLTLTIRIGAILLIGDFILASTAWFLTAYVAGSASRRERPRLTAALGAS